VVTLIKPQYEAPKDVLRQGVVPPERLDEVLEACRRDVRLMGWKIANEVESPIRGHGGNCEQLW